MNFVVNKNNVKRCGEGIPYLVRRRFKRRGSYEGRITMGTSRLPGILLSRTTYLSGGDNRL